MNNLNLHIKRGKILAPILIQRHKDGKIFGRKGTPETKLPQGIKQGSKKHFRYVTMVAPLTYIREAEDLFARARQTYEDPKTRFVFNPKTVAKCSGEKVLKAISKYGMAKRVNRETYSFWIPFCRNLVYYFGGDPLNLFESCDYDALKIFDKLHNQYSNLFPMISGPKILPMYLRMLAKMGFSLKNLDKIDIPVDTHVLRATFILGCITGRFEGDVNEANSIVRRYWRTVCAEEKFMPLEVDEPLWNLSKYGCRTRRETYCPKDKRCPLTAYCQPGRYSSNSTTGYVEVDI